MFRRVGIILSLIAVVAVSCGGEDDSGGGVSQSELKKFCAAGQDLVEAVVEDPTSDDAVDAFNDLDQDVADELDIRIRRLDPERSDDAADMADRLIEAGCDKDDFEDALAALDTTVPRTDPDETDPDDTDPDDTDLPVTTVTPDSRPPLPPDQLLMAVPVPAAPASAEAIAKVEAATPLTDHDVVSVVQTYGMTTAGLAMVVPEGGYLYGFSSDSTFLSQSDSLTFLFADGGTAQATIDALAAAAKELDSFDVNTSTDTSDGTTTTRVELSQSDFDGPDYTFTAVTTGEDPEVMDVTVERRLFSSDNVAPPVPASVADATAAQAAAAAKAGAPVATGWSARVGYDRQYDYPSSVYSLYWPDSPGDYKEIGTAICVEQGFEVPTDLEYSVSCTSDDYLVSWSVSEGFEPETYSLFVSVTVE
jgi:hypothetical protein